MMKHIITTIRVKTGSSWIRIDKVNISYYASYKDDYFYNTSPCDIDIREIDLPAWASYLKDKIVKYLEAFPEKINPVLIEVDI